MEATESSRPPPHGAQRGIKAWNEFVPHPFGLGCFLLFFAALLISRRPDCIVFPQFWAEEGSRFFVEARERLPWVNLFDYSYGYFDLLIRLTQQIAASVPLEMAPLILVLSAIAIQAIVPTFVVSSRCTGWMGPFPVRLLAAILYCGMPNSFEVHCIQLHSRVHLAVLAALILLSAPPRSLFGKIFDLVALILAGLSGPFVLLLAPVAIWRHLHARTSVSRAYCWILIVTLCGELFALVGSLQSRLGHPVGAGFWEGVRLIGGQFTIGFLLGEKSYAQILSNSHFDTIALGAFLALLAIVVLIIKQVTWQARALLFVGLGTFALALIAPYGGAPGMTQWHAMWSIPGNGQRYYFLPMATILFALAAVVGRSQARLWRLSAAALLLFIAAMAVRIDWVLPALDDLHFRHYVNLYQSAPPGTSVSIPINPFGWKMELKKPAAAEP